MGKGLRVVLIVLFALLLCSPVYALMSVTDNILSVTDIVGDKDGFGLNVDVGQVVDYDPFNGLAPGKITDGWTNRGSLPLSWEHEYSLYGFSSITDAYLKIFTGGQGFYGTSRVFLDGEEIGNLTDGEVDGQNFARLDTFDIFPYISLLGDGHVSISVLTQYSNGGYSDPAGVFGADNWILDYSQLTIDGVSDAAPAPVPEPSSILLLGIGLIGLAGYGRKKIKIRA